MNLGLKTITAFVVLLLSINISAREAKDYLPGDANPDPSIPTPESVLGWNVGDWHVSHDKLVNYLQLLAEASPRVSIKVIGYTHEKRPLLQLAITSEENQQKLEPLRQSHLNGDGPLVLWLGYSVHGDEPSGSNASMLVAYYLASSRSPLVQNLLADSIILIDPSINPDGLNRFANWANSNAGKMPVSDPQTRQHVQDWPEGRTNHYWFDLNRDWLPLVHPESRARLVEYHRWLPHVLTDHHEQDGYPGFFFQPGVPSRQNPLTPPENLELTRALAVYHSAAMDTAGQPHFTEEAYDDFYFGKGSTYPDINGSIGILFEQRAILGQQLLTSNGTETFQMAVANQLRMSLSTLKGSWELKDRLLAYQAGFSDLMMQRAAKKNFRAWLVSDDGDTARAGQFLELLEMHQVSYLPLNESITVGGYQYTAGHAWVIPVRQKQFGLLEAMMEQRTEFSDQTFYDVSAWTLPLAYNLPFDTISRMPETGEPIQGSRGTTPARNVPAYAIPWSQLGAPPLLQKLLTAGAKVRSSTKPFSAQTSAGLQAFSAGTLVVQVGIQDRDQLQVFLELLDQAALDGLDVVALQSTMTAVGPDLGSASFPIIKPVRPLIVGGSGTSAYEAGEAWYLLDQRLGLATPIIEINRLGGVELSKYTHLLLPDGDYSSINPEQKDRIAAWIRAGGILVTLARASTWAETLCFAPYGQTCEPAIVTESEQPEEVPRPYGDFANDKAQQVIGGAIVASHVDLSHPLAFGYHRPELPLLRRGTTQLAASKNPYSTPVQYSNSPLMAGFIGKEQLQSISGQAAVIVEKKEKGLIVKFANNPLFRGFWRGTERLYINALFLGQVIEATDLPVFIPQAEPESLRH